jgi:glycosyltransferase involved in cell wall biosynthesis
MRVLYVIDSMGLGGAEAALRNLIEQLPKSDPSIHLELVTVFAHGLWPEHQLDPVIAADSLNVRFKYDGRAIPRLVRKIHHGQYDVVHAHLFPANYLAAAASFFVHGPRWVYTEHNIWNRRRKIPPLKLIERVIYSRYQGVVAVCQPVVDSLLSWQPQLRSKIVIIPNGVPIRDQPPDPLITPASKSVRFFFAGRLEHAKGVDLLIEALAQVDSTHFELIVAGHGSQRAYLEQLATDRGLGQRVRFVGANHDLSEWMKSADCLVLLSRWEGLPMVVLEAMERGLPVIASDVGGLPEMIVDGVNGYLVSSGDVGALAQRLQAIIETPDMLRSLGAAARQTIIEGYSINRVAQQHLELYQSLIN